jgi:hypothetical protein
MPRHKRNRPVGLKLEQHSQYWVTPPATAVDQKPISTQPVPKLHKHKTCMLMLLLLLLATLLLVPPT